MGIPMVSHFKLTSADTLKYMVANMMKHWNIPRDASSCCSFHTMLNGTMTILGKMIDGPCQPHFSPHTEWQCSSCTATNSADAVRCVVCFELRLRKGDSPALSSRDPPSSYDHN